jgi:hypothetical protein
MSRLGDVRTLFERRSRPFERRPAGVLWARAGSLELASATWAYLYPTWRTAG